MFGGDHGKLKYGPPDNFSPCYECLRPKQKLRLEPCFQLGDLPKGLLVGPAEIRDHEPFVPRPVDTNNVSTFMSLCVFSFLAVSLFWPLRFCVFTFCVLAPGSVRLKTDVCSEIIIP